MHILGKWYILFFTTPRFPLLTESWYWLIWLSPQVTISKFHLWNLKFGSCRRLWTFLKKIYEFRKVQQGSEDLGQEDGEDEASTPANSNSIEALAAKLKAMQKSRHTLDLVCDIFADFRVRTLGYMRLIWWRMYFFPITERLIIISGSLRVASHQSSGTLCCWFQKVA